MDITKFSYVLDSNYIEDDCVNKFHEILANNTNYCPANSVYELLVPDLRRQVQPISPDQEHLQLLFRDSNGTDIELAAVGHWVCIHHIDGELRVYDSLYDNLTHLQSACIAALFPHAPKVVFPSVQKQTNGVDCGVFAIAFATSIALGEDPCGRVFDTSTMRPRLYEMLQREALMSFPSEISAGSRSVEKSLRHVRGRPNNRIGSKRGRKCIVKKRVKIIKIYPGFKKAE